MIYCVCSRLNTAKVDAAIEGGARSAACVLAHHGTQFNCGNCKASIEERLAATQRPACLNQRSDAADIGLAAE